MIRHASQPVSRNEKLTPHWVQIGHDGHRDVRCDISEHVGEDPRRNQREDQALAQSLGYFRVTKSLILRFLYHHPSISPLPLYRTPITNLFPGANTITLHVSMSKSALVRPNFDRHYTSVPLMKMKSVTPWEEPTSGIFYNLLSSLCLFDHSPFYWYTNSHLYQFIDKQHAGTISSHYLSSMTRIYSSISIPISSFSEQHLDFRWYICAWTFRLVCMSFYSLSIEWMRCDYRLMISSKDGRYWLSQESDGTVLKKAGARGLERWLWSNIKLKGQLLTN
jgi:hypothetical protein